MRVLGSAMPVPRPAVATLAPSFGPCRTSEEDRGPDQTAVNPWSPWQPDPAYGGARPGVIAVPPGVRILLATRPVDFRKGMDGLAALVQQALRADPFAGDVF